MVSILFLFGGMFLEKTVFNESVWFVYDGGNKWSAVDQFDIGSPRFC
jgi:hypothetical protein